MLSYLFIFFIIFILFFFLNENNSLRARAIFLILFISINFFCILLLASNSLFEKIKNFFGIATHQLLLAAILTLIIIYVIYIYNEINILKNIIVKLVRAKAFQDIHVRINKKKIK
jgi:hypothetical protein